MSACGPPRSITASSISASKGAVWMGNHMVGLCSRPAFYPAGSHNHPARDTRALAQGRLSLLLALEVAPTGRATADRHGAARIDPADEHGESALGRATHPRRTVKLGFEGAQSSVAKYMVNRRGPPSQGCRTFLRNHRNHAPDIA